MPVTYADEEREPLETEWTWEGRLPRGAVVLVAGWRQSAKGLLACHIAAAVTKGRPLPGEESGREPGDVVMVMAEDDPNEDMAWRLRAADADLSRVHDFTELDDGSPFELSASATVPGNTPDLLAFIRQLREQGRNPRLVILDPLNALVMYGSIKTDQGARRVIGRLRQVAKRTGVTILVVHHFVKSGSIGGSQGIVDAPRWVYEIQPDPASPEYKIFHLYKCNVAVGEDLRYRIISDGHNSRIEWVDREQMEREERSWRSHDKAGVKAMQPVTPQQARGAGCRHPFSKFGTPKQCGDCPARKLKPASTPVRPAKPAPSRPVTPAPKAAPVAPRRAAGRVYGAGYASFGPDGTPVSADLGEYPSELAAQLACARHAGAAMAWRESVPGWQWVASTGTGAQMVSYCVKAAPAKRAAAAG